MEGRSLSGEREARCEEFGESRWGAGCARGTGAQREREGKSITCDATNTRMRVISAMTAYTDEI